LLERLQAPKGRDKRFLSEVLGGLTAAHESFEQPQNLRLMSLDERGVGRMLAGEYSFDDLAVLHFDASSSKKIPKNFQCQSVGL
jgi:hypothetical protein